MKGSRRVFLAFGLGLAVLAMVVAPASAAKHHAKAPVKFGALLTDHTQPSNSNPPHKCSEADGDPLEDASCTRLMFSSEIGSPGGRLKAPSAGTITKIFLIAGHTGQLTPVVGFLSNADPSGGNGKITAKGPVLHYVSSGFDEPITIQSFNVSIKVKKGEVLGFRSRSTSVARCDQGSTRQILFQPPLVVGAAPVNSGSTDDCSMLMEAQMTPA
jgi:hypothetical protein